MQQAFMGIDGGGTNTRAIAVGLDGRLLGYAQTGGSNPQHDADYLKNLPAAIRACADGVGLSNITRIVAGLAGVDSEQDLPWAQEAMRVPGLTATPTIVNDADVALFGALSSRPGIVAVQGTGSIIVGRTESGLRVSNSDFFHYAHASALWLAGRAVHLILAGRYDDSDNAFVDEVLRFWGVASVEALRELGSRKWDLPRYEMMRQFGAIAPIVTAAAGRGSNLATFVCCECGEKIAVGVFILGPLCSGDIVEVTLAGSCARSVEIRKEVSRYIERSPEKTYRLVDPEFPPVAGAALMALAQEGIVLSPDDSDRLRAASWELAPEPRQRS